MKARRTPWWWYVIAMLVGLLAGMGISHLEETRGLGLAGIPYLASAVMVVVGFIVLYLAWQVHKYTTTDPKKRAQLKPMDSERCVNTLIVSKALAIAGALLAGWYGGQIVMLYDRFEAPFFRHIVIECIIAVIASVIDMVLGIISEDYASCRRTWDRSIRRSCANAVRSGWRGSLTGRLACRCRPQGIMPAITGPMRATSGRSPAISWHID